MEKHEHIQLYLDHDEAGKKWLEIALKRSPKYKDESSLYEGYKDLNDWVMNFGKIKHKQSLKQSSKMGLPKLFDVASYVLPSSKRWLFHPDASGFKK